MRATLVSGMVAGLVLVGLSAAPGGPAQARVTPKCHGHVATIVGNGGRQDIEGTAGNDVIVAPGTQSQTVEAHGGKDIICLGAGNDDANGGPGDDLVYGGGGRDYMFSDAGTDRFVGGGGNDRFRADLESAGTGIDIRGGAGDDSIEALILQPTADFTAVGGDGTDDVTLEEVPAATQLPVTVDAGAGTITIDGAQRGQVTGWEELGLAGFHDWTYVGTDGIDHLTTFWGDYQVQLAGGDDWVKGDGTVNNTEFVDGGSGSDTGRFGPDGTYTCVSVETVADGACPAPTP